MSEDQKKWNEGNVAGKHADMGINTVRDMDSEGQLKGSNQRRFDEQSAQDHEHNDENELNKTDERGTIGGNGSV